MSGRSISPDLIDRLRARFEERQSQRYLHCEITELELDRACLAIDFLPQFDNGGGSIHGGVLSMLADTAVACALSTNFDGKMGFATSNLSIHFLRRAKTRIVADARILKKGAKVCVGYVEMFDDDGKLVATSTCDFVLTTSRLPSRSPAPDGDLIV